MFIGAIRKGKSIDGYIRDGLVEVHNIRKRHDELAEEIEARGYNHKSPLPEVELWEDGEVNVDRSIGDLRGRCDACFSLLDYPFPN